MTNFRHTSPSRSPLLPNLIILRKPLLTLLSFIVTCDRLVNTCLDPSIPLVLTLMAFFHLLPFQHPFRYHIR